MKKNKESFGLYLVLLNISSVLSGLILVMTATLIVEVHDGEIITGWMPVFAYMSGSIGFMLSAPLNQLKKIEKSFYPNIFKIILLWILTSLAIIMLATLCGLAISFVTKSITSKNDMADIVSAFIGGALLLYVSGGIHWLAYRNKATESE